MTQKIEILHFFTKKTGFRVVNSVSNLTNNDTTGFYVIVYYTGNVGINNITDGGNSGGQVFDQINWPNSEYVPVKSWFIYRSRGEAQDGQGDEILRMSITFADNSNKKWTIATDSTNQGGFNR